MKKRPFIIFFILISLFLYSCSFDKVIQEVDLPLAEAQTQSTTSKKLLIITYIDVGQGDSALIQFTNGKTMLIDSGEYSSYEAVTQTLDTYHIRTIDTIVITHPHTDHMGSMSNIINQYKVQKIYVPNVMSNTKTFETLLQTVADNKLKLTKAKGGMTIDLDETVKVDILSPNKDEYEDINDYSLILKITYEDTSFLFTGDAGITPEEELLDLDIDLSADVLKIGHHGSNTSTTTAFLKKVRPTYGIISVGIDNSYGHPKQRVLDRLADFGVTVYRTDELGSIVLSSDGTDIIFKKITALR